MREKKIQDVAERAALNKMEAQVRADFDKKVETELIRGGPEAADKFKLTFAAKNGDIGNFIRSRASEELAKE